jgi:hypothetical protein
MNTAKMMGLKELASCYYPDIRPDSASTRLRAVINRHSELKAKLLNAGYEERQRTFTPRQVALLFDYLGEPRGGKR